MFLRNCAATEKKSFLICFAIMVCNLCDGQLYSQTTAQFGQGFTADGRSPLLEYSSRKRLRVELQPTAQGLKVVRIYDNSPVLRLRSPANRELIAAMELGDTIVSLNGNRVTAPDDLVNALQVSQGECEIEVLDINTNQPIVWLVEPANTFTPLVSVPTVAPTVAKIHVVIAAATLDTKLGSAIATTVEKIRQALVNELDPSRLSITLVSGEDCTAMGIAKGIDNLTIGFDDCLFVYFLGHGAYDSRLQESDPFGGHFFDFPGTDLLRRTVWSHLDAKPARLKILVSDSCNVKGLVSSQNRSYTVESVFGRTVTESTNLEWLLLGHSGTLDINAASKDEYAWYSKIEGGWFTSAFVRLMNQDSRWNTVTSQLPAETNRVFQQNKRTFLGIPATTNPIEASALNQQRSMTPSVSADVDRDASPPFPVGISRNIGKPRSNF